MKSLSSSSSSYFLCEKQVERTHKHNHHPMPPLLTQVARTSDSLPLVACTTATHTLPVTSKHQQDAQQLMKRMTTGCVRAASCVGQKKIMFLLRLTLSCRSPNKMSIATGNYCFYYMARDNLCFLTLCEESFPKRSAFLYLEEIADLILQEMIREYGNDVSTVCERNPPLLGISTRLTQLYFAVAKSSRPSGTALSIHSL
jgi:hypothetical protein